MQTVGEKNKHIYHGEALLGNFFKNYRGKLVDFSDVINNMGRKLICTSSGRPLSKYIGATQAMKAQTILCTVYLERAWELDNCVSALQP